MQVSFNEAQTATLAKFLAKWSAGGQMGATQQGDDVYLAFEEVSVFLKEDGSFDIVED